MQAKTATAVIDGAYRYELWRTLDTPLAGSNGTVAFCMLNPSTADGTRDDPTIRRCMAYAQAWGYHKLAVVNLYALRATAPIELWAAGRTGFDIVGPRNWLHIERVLRVADMAVAAWGTQAPRAQVAELTQRCGPAGSWYALKLTREGMPAHPLYLPKQLVAKPVLYHRAAGAFVYAAMDA